MQNLCSWKSHDGLCSYWIKPTWMCGQTVYNTAVQRCCCVNKISGIPIGYNYTMLTLQKVMHSCDKSCRMCSCVGRVCREKWWLKVITLKKIDTQYRTYIQCYGRIHVSWKFQLAMSLPAVSSGDILRWKKGGTAVVGRFIQRVINGMVVSGLCFRKALVSTG